MTDSSVIVCATQGVELVSIIGLVMAAITIFAIFRAPITALRVQKAVEANNEQKKIQLGIFKTLLATRANILSSEHVAALNMIDIEFYRENKIRAAWNLYRDHLHTPAKDDIDRWEENRINYFTDLLYAMSQYFGYDFDKVILKKGAYSPQAHGFLNLEMAAIRNGLVEILTGKKAIKVDFSKMHDADSDSERGTNSENKEVKSE